MRKMRGERIDKQSQALRREDGGFALSVSHSLTAQLRMEME